MKKLLTSFVFVLCSIPFFAQSWYVQVGVFEEKVSPSYFGSLANKVYYSYDSYGFHRYYTGIYNSETEAKAASDQVRQMGYNVALASSDEFGTSCRCPFISIPESLWKSLQNIFFDFDQSYLTGKAKSQLRDLANVMKEFPGYTVNLRAHTDAKGSNEYNEALSMRRANSAKNYLTARGIDASRIRTETFGEASPIAKNELDGGQDTEEGRQFNRRVEIQIYDQAGNLLNQLVDEIDVPDALKN
jgi:outer membrane protein OmpA-like peptidoglycan-associated protein